MSNIETLLKAAAPEALRPQTEVVEADLARGRAALATAHRHRTYRRLSLGAGSLAAAAVAVVVLTTSGQSTHGSSTAPGPGATVQAKVNPPAGTTKVTSHPQIRLVDYSGAQLPGFTVSQVPQGWHLSTSTSTALLITPDGSTNNDPDVFEGKLAVLTSSTDQHGLGNGDPVTVNGQAGRVSRQPGYLILAYNSPGGFGVDIQAPESLHWTDTQIVQFADGVQVTASAVHTHG